MDPWTWSLVTYILLLYGITAITHWYSNTMLLPSTYVIIYVLNWNPFSPSFSVIPRQVGTCSPLIQRSYCVPHVAGTVHKVKCEQCQIFPFLDALENLHQTSSTSLPCSYLCTDVTILRKRPITKLLYFYITLFTLLLSYSIIIIIWHYNPLWVFTFSAKSLQVLLSLSASFQFLTFSFFRSSMTSSCHRCLGPPTSLVPIGFQSSSFLVDLAWSILWICPSHLILCVLVKLTISAPSINP